MAKLIIFRGDTIDREVDLDDRSARIGRGDQNDIILPDPAKSVSRFHAELRCEQGKYVIVDLNSQNGVWAAGRRVPQVTLEPGVPVVLGSYKLMLKQELPPVSGSTDATVIASMPGTDSASAATTVVPMRPAGPAAPPPPKPGAPTPVLTPEPPSMAPAPPRLDPPKPAARPEAPPPPKPVPPRPLGRPEPPPRAGGPPPAPAKPAAPGKPAVAARASAPPKPAGKGMSKGLWAGLAIVVLLAVTAGALFLTPLGSQLGNWIGGKPADPSAATAPAAGEPAKPTETQPPAEASTPPVELPAAAPPVAEPVVPPPAAVNPAPPPARAVADPPPVAPARVVKPPASQRTPAAATGGRRGAPAGADTKPKPPDLSQTLEEARVAVTGGDYPAAIAKLESILATDPNYPNAAELMTFARGRARDASQAAVDAGNKAEAAGDYDGAQTQFDRALQLDPQSASASDAIRRLKARKQTEGEDAFKRARQYDALNRVQDAISMYEKALRLLPPDHASAKAARERLAALKGGV